MAPSPNPNQQPNLRPLTRPKINITLNWPSFFLCFGHNRKGAEISHDYHNAGYLDDENNCKDVNERHSFWLNLIAQGWEPKTYRSQDGPVKRKISNNILLFRILTNLCQMINTKRLVSHQALVPPSRAVTAGPKYSVKPNFPMI